MRCRFVAAIADIPAADWNALAGAAYPFARHEFLQALEASGSVGPGSGWLPHHLLLYAGERLAGALPCYRKTHSYGEYVFDWAWADAYRRHGLAYYPKLLAAIPFTPATGPRLLLAEGIERAAAVTAVAAALDGECARLGASSWHLLFPEEDVSAAFAVAGADRRLGVQYHWDNPGYRDFDAFLQQLTSRKRKALRRERELVQEQGIVLRRLGGREVSPALWDRFHAFYQLTYARRSGHGGYLARDFFHRLGAVMPEQLLLVIAEKDGEVVAGALNFCGADTLYGRYWGCTAEYTRLHFEACYYQGMEHCIAAGLRRFDAGAQGEHKLARGFAPQLTCSNHRILHPAFRAAIDEWLTRERHEMQAYVEAARAELPFRQSP